MFKLLGKHHWTHEDGGEDDLCAKAITSAGHKFVTRYQLL
jgi:hypothetical protein